MGFLEELEERISKASLDNSKRKESVETGKKYIGEYHAQLVLDQIYLNNLLKNLEEEHIHWKQREETLKGRIEYLFLDCARLTKHNATIVQDGKVLDGELAEMYVEMELAKSKFRTLHKNILHNEEERASAAGVAFKAGEQLRETKKKLIRQHQGMWEMDDTIESLKTEIESLKEKIREAKEASKKMQTKATVEDSDIEGIQQGVIPQKSDDRKLPESHLARARCLRDDCTMFREKLKDVNTKIVKLTRQTGGEFGERSLRKVDDLESTLPSIFGESGRKRRSITAFVDVD